MGTSVPQLTNGAVVLLLTVLSGLLDGRGFVYASRAWPQGVLDWRMAGASIAAFGAGLACYVLAIKYLQHLGVLSVALQSGIWFVVTAVGISLMDGRIGEWTRSQQVVALMVAAGLCWLLASTSGNARG
jgi:hypothetical protein